MVWQLPFPDDDNCGIINTNDDEAADDIILLGSCCGGGGNSVPRLQSTIIML
jgi:hypothetical protein